MTVQIGVSFRLELDDGFDPPQGTAFVQDSSIFKETSEGGEMKGFWQVGPEPSPNIICSQTWCPMNQIDGVMKPTIFCEH